MSAAEVCELHSKPINSFCGTHFIPCCDSCHSVAYPKCQLKILSKATAKLAADVKEYELSLDKLISAAHDMQESVPSWLTKQNGRESDMIMEVQNLFSLVRQIVDDCEKHALNRVKETMSKHKLAAQCVGKVVNVLSELKKERQVELSPEQDAESRSCEGAAINPGGEDVPVESHATGTSEVSAPKRAKALNKRSIKLHQAISNSKALLSDFEDLSPIDYKTVINKGVFDSVEKILNDSCVIGICQKPISQLIKELDFSYGGTQSVMTFLHDTPTSDLIIASYNPNTLRVVTQSGIITKFVTLNYQPYGVCSLNDRVYVTHEEPKQISVFQTSDLSHQTMFPVSGSCVGIVFVGGRLIVACPNDRCVRAITTSGKVIAQSSHAFQKPWCVAVSPEADALFVTDIRAFEVIVLSQNLATHLRSIPSGGTSPIGVCVFGANIYVCNYTSHDVMELSCDGQRSRSVISVTDPVGICVNPARMCFMVSNAANDSITSYVGQL